MRATTSFVTRVGACLVAALAALAGAGGPARADGADADEAMRLRNASTEDWNAKRYAEAAVKLRRAVAIYETAPAKHAADLAVARRALVWNLVKAGDVEAAFGPFDGLIAGAKADPALRSELFTAYGALYEAARDAGSIEAAHKVLDRVRLRAAAEADAGVASQVLHDLASIARDRGAPEEARALLEQAVAERRAAKAPTELAWSLNNLANLHLAEGRLDAALAPLLEAHRLVLEEAAIAPQSAVGVNTKTALDRLAAAEAPTAAQRAWVWDLAEVAARSPLAAIHRSEVLLRAALRLDAAAGTPAERLASARRLAKLVLTPTPAPKEIRADLLLHAATVAIGAGGATDALGWLASVEVGTGPAAGHLAARRGVAVATARAAQRQGGETTAAVEDARTALRALGDRGLREASLDALAGATEAAGLGALAASLREELAASRRDGQPGARGASAMSGGDLEKFRGLAAHDPVFELRAIGIRLRATDILTGTVVELDGTWQPQAVALHGLTLKGFGAYVRVDRFAYGEAAVASNAGPTTLTLADLEPYLVVPGTGVLHILRNGAVTYLP